MRPNLVIGRQHCRIRPLPVSPTTASRCSLSLRQPVALCALDAKPTPPKIRQKAAAATIHIAALPRHLFFNFPFGITVVTGGVGRSDVLDGLGGGLVSFLGFFAILLLR